MRQEVVIDYVRSRYPEWVSISEVVDGIYGPLDRDTGLKRKNSASLKLRSLLKFDMVEREETPDGVRYRWIPFSEAGE